MRFRGFIVGWAVPKVDSTTESLTGYICTLMTSVHGPVGRGREITARDDKRLPRHSCESRNPGSCVRLRRRVVYWIPGQARDDGAGWSG